MPSNSSCALRRIKRKRPYRSGFFKPHQIQTALKAVSGVTLLVREEKEEVRYSGLSRKGKKYLARQRYLARKSKSSIQSGKIQKRTASSTVPPAKLESAFSALASQSTIMMSVNALTTLFVVAVKYCSQMSSSFAVVLRLLNLLTKRIWFTPSGSLTLGKRCATWMRYALLSVWRRNHD